MFRNYQLSFLVLLFFVFIFELVGFFSLSPNYSLFYYPNLQDEASSRLYSKLDPILGYTWNREIVEGESERKSGSTLTKKWVTEGSYIKFSHRYTAKAINILIYGGSATDSNLFHGNWPYYLHKYLKERNIPHQIINGAVSGYSTNQELLKLIRDINHFENIDLIVSYSGINDFVDNGDVYPETPWVHPYEAKNYRILAGDNTQLIKSTLLPNTVSLMRRIFSHKKTPIDFGFKQSSYAKRFYQNISMMRVLSQQKSIPFLHFLQPLAINNNWKIKDNYLDEDDIYTHKANSFYKDFLMFSKNYSIQVQNELLKESPIFVDFVHMNILGHYKVAEVIWKKISSLSLDKLQ